MTDREVMQQALEALETYKGFIDDAHIIEGQWHWLDGSDNAIAALRTALEKPEQVVDCPRCGHVCSQRPWQGLTDEEITELRLKTFDAVATNYESYRAIEAKLKEKNNAN
jgi:hypothetical protein